MLAASQALFAAGGADTPMDRRKFINTHTYMARRSHQTRPVRWSSRNTPAWSAGSATTRLKCDRTYAVSSFVARLLATWIGEAPKTGRPCVGQPQAVRYLHRVDLSGRSVFKLIHADRRAVVHASARRSKRTDLSTLTHRRIKFGKPMRGRGQHPYPPVSARVDLVPAWKRPNGHFL
jgi:hypothetical protein